jgi:acyl-CoA thioesterase FadM
VTYEYAAHKVSDDDALMVTATQTLVLIDHDDRTTRPVPDSFRSHVAAFEGAEL